MLLNRLIQGVEGSPSCGGFDKQPDKVRIQADSFSGGVPREAGVNRLGQSEQNPPTKPSRVDGLRHVISVCQMILDPKPLGLVQVFNGLFGSVAMGNATGKIDDLGCPITPVIRFMRQLHGVVQSQIVFQRLTRHSFPLSANDTWSRLISTTLLLRSSVWRYARIPDALHHFPRR